MQGGYDDWLMQRKQSEQNSAASDLSAKPAKLTLQANNKKAVEKPKKLSFNEKRELEQLPEQIETQEQRQQQLEAHIAASDFYQQDQTKIKKVLTELDAIQKQLEKSYQRWEKLDNL